MSRRHRVRSSTPLGLISPASRHVYFRELHDVLGHCLDTGEIAPWRRFVWSWIRKGAPIDSQAALAPDASLRVVFRQMATALPGLGRHHADAKLWLTHPEVRLYDPATGTTAKAGATKQLFTKPFHESFIPWNCFLHAPEGTPYHEYNRVGLTLDYVEREDAA